MRVADQAWIATALLHREHPESSDFSLDEVLGRAGDEFGYPLQPGVRQHIVSHGVAQIEPTPARLRMFTRTERARRRLFRPGDTANKNRTGRTHPDPRQLDEKYRPLVDWYLREYAPVCEDRGSPPPSGSPSVLLEFVGTISAYDLKIMSEAIERDCERIENNGESESSVA
jgi:hypothetical protein